MPGRATCTSPKSCRERAPIRLTSTASSMASRSNWRFKPVPLQTARRRCPAAGSEPGSWDIDSTCHGATGRPRSRATCGVPGPRTGDGAQNSLREPVASVTCRQGARASTASGKATNSAAETGAISSHQRRKAAGWPWRRVRAKTTAPDLSAGGPT
jgi:hypothetical protein